MAYWEYEGTLLSLIVTITGSGVNRSRPMGQASEHRGAGGRLAAFGLRVQFVVRFGHRCSVLGFGFRVQKSRDETPLP